LRRSACSSRVRRDKRSSDAIASGKRRSAFGPSRRVNTLALSDFDWRFDPKLPHQACFKLHTLKFIGEGANALIIGKPGTGKSHVAQDVAYQATLQGHDVRYVEADTEFARFALGRAIALGDRVLGARRVRLEILPTPYAQCVFRLSHTTSPRHRSF
jgi:DNA replication protein DnaC